MIDPVPSSEALIPDPARDLAYFLAVTLAEDVGVGEGPVAFATVELVNLLYAPQRTLFDAVEYTLLESNNLDDIMVKCDYSK